MHGEIIPAINLIFCDDLFLILEVEWYIRRCVPQVPHARGDAAVLPMQHLAGPRGAGPSAAFWQNTGNISTIYYASTLTFNIINNAARAIFAVTVRFTWHVAP